MSRLGYVVFCRSDPYYHIQRKKLSKNSRKTAETSQKGTVKGIKSLRFAEALDFARHGVKKINNFAT